MRIVRTLLDMRSLVTELRVQNKLIGLVPTMGALHDGHLALIQKARNQSDFVVCSIFINPTQFNNTEDLEKYPRNEERDFQLLTSKNCDAVFVPDANEMYPKSDDAIDINFGSLQETLEGKFRSGHFTGVGIIVAKLFNIVQPKFAFFGRKDLQQLAVIKKLVRVFNFPVEIVPVETQRESTGLAMSSRNMLFSEPEKKDAAVLHEGLLKTKNGIAAGTSIEVSKKQVVDELNKLPFVQIEYLEVVNTETLSFANNLRPNIEYAICCAAVVHRVRLIDNVII